MFCQNLSFNITNPVKLPIIPIFHFTCEIEVTSVLSLHRVAMRGDVNNI